MDVIVIGGGVAGVTTAYALREAGHRVCVIERHTTVAQEATFGMGGLILPTALDTWFGPTMPGSRWQMRFGRNSGLIYRPGMNLEVRRWMRRWRSERKPERFAAQYSRLRSLSELARAELAAIENRHNLEIEQRSGVLHLFRSAQDLKQAASALALLKEPEYLHRMLSAAECVALEPSIPSAQPLVGGVLLPGDRSANCPLFAKQMKQLLNDNNVTFMLESTALAIEVLASGVRVKLTARIDPFERHGSRPLQACEEISADAVVVAAGARSLGLLADAGLRLPLHPVRMHALMAPILHEELAPHLTLVDTARRITISRLNNRMKLTGAALIQGRERTFSPPDRILRNQALDMLAQAAHDWAPGAVKFSSARQWDGIRLLSPDGLPVVSRTAHPRLFVNLAHGPSGWGLAAGAAALLAELVSGASEPALDELLGALSAARFKR
jgi:D-amino-acid dehydrogenase